jgi:hypothetical protein
MVENVGWSFGNEYCGNLYVSMNALTGINLTRTLTTFSLSDENVLFGHTSVTLLLTLKSFLSLGGEAITKGKRSASPYLSPRLSRLGQGEDSYCPIAVLDPWHDSAHNIW